MFCTSVPCIVFPYLEDKNLVPGECGEGVTSLSRTVTTSVRETMQNFKRVSLDFCL